MTINSRTDYGKLTPLLVKSVQDLQAENYVFKARTDQTEADSVKLKAEARFKAALCAKFSDLPCCAANLAEYSAT